MPQVYTAKQLLKPLQKINLFIVSLALLFSYTSSIASEPKKVVFLSPGHQESPFFTPTIAIMREAAIDLGLDLEIIYSNDLVIFSEQASALLKRTELPDYLILTSLRGVTEELMVEADGLGIHTLVFNAGLPPEAITRFRTGDRPLKHWIGQVLPNDRQAGRMVAERLVESARSAERYDDSGKIQLVGLNGSMRSPASIEREIGLRQYVAEQTDVHIQQVVYTEWHQDEARRKAKLLFKRFDDVSVVWTAADALALGSAYAATSLGLAPSKDVFIAGVDWLPEVHQDIADGIITGSVGGHCYDGAWGLSVIYDHIHGYTKDFVDARTHFHWVDINDVDAMAKLMDPLLWRDLDFRQFTKTHNHETSYRFGVERILETYAAPSQ